MVENSLLIGDGHLSQSCSSTTSSYRDTHHTHNNTNTNNSKNNAGTQNSPPHRPSLSRNSHRSFIPASSLLLQYSILLFLLILSTCSCSIQISLAQNTDTTPTDTSSPPVNSTSSPPPLSNSSFPDSGWDHGISNDTWSSTGADQTMSNDTSSGSTAASMPPPIDNSTVPVSVSSSSGGWSNDTLGSTGETADYFPIPVARRLGVWGVRCCPNCDASCGGRFVRRVCLNQTTDEIISSFSCSNVPQLSVDSYLDWAVANCSLAGCASWNNTDQFNSSTLNCGQSYEWPLAECMKDGVVYPETACWPIPKPAPLLVNRSDCMDSIPLLPFVVTAEQPLFEPRMFTSLGVLNGDVYLIGGLTATSAANPSAVVDIWVSRDFGMNWDKVNVLTPTFTSIRDHTVEVIGNSLFVIGGKQGAIPSSYVWRSDDAGVTWYKCGQLPGGRAQHDSAKFRTGLVILGGTSKNADSLNDVLSSTDASHFYVQTASAPWAARTYPTIDVLQDRLILYGGWLGNGKAARDVWSTLDMVAWTQVTMATPFAPRSGYVFYTTGRNNLVVMGGITENGGRYLTDQWVSGDGGISWQLRSPTAGLAEGQPTPTPFSPRSWAGFVKANGERLLVVAGEHDGTWLNDVWLGSLSAKWPTQLLNNDTSSTEVTTSSNNHTTILIFIIAIAAVGLALTCAAAVMCHVKRRKHRKEQPVHGLVPSVEMYGARQLEVVLDPLPMAALAVSVSRVNSEGHVSRSGHSSMREGERTPMSVPHPGVSNRGMAINLGAPAAPGAASASASVDNPDSALPTTPGAPVAQPPAALAAAPRLSASATQSSAVAPTRNGRSRTPSNSNKKSSRKSSNKHTRASNSMSSDGAIPSGRGSNVRVKAAADGELLSPALQSNGVSPTNSSTSNASSASPQPASSSSVAMHVAPLGMPLMAVAPVPTPSPVLASPPPPFELNEQQLQWMQAQIQYQASIIAAAVVATSPSPAAPSLAMSGSSPLADGNQEYFRSVPQLSRQQAEVFYGAPSSPAAAGNPFAALSSPSQLGVATFHLPQPPVNSSHGEYPAETEEYEPEPGESLLGHDGSDVAASASAAMAGEHHASSMRSAHAHDMHFTQHAAFSAALQQPLSSIAEGEASVSRLADADEGDPDSTVNAPSHEGSRPAH